MLPDLVRVVACLEMSDLRLDGGVGPDSSGSTPYFILLVLSREWIGMGVAGMIIYY